MYQVRLKNLIETTCDSFFKSLKYARKDILLVIYLALFKNMLKIKVIL